MLLASDLRLNPRTGPNLEGLPAERLPAGYDEADVAVLRWIASQRSEAVPEVVIAPLRDQSSRADICRRGPIERRLVPTSTPADQDPAADDSAHAG